ncbi:MAG: glycosyltransferase [Pseudomonadota bacterium]
MTSSAPTALKKILRPPLGMMRALPVHFAHARLGGRGPMALFLPARGPSGASLLRSYAMAEGLRAKGWRTLVLPWKLTLAQRSRFIARALPDVLVMQSARHELNDPALYPGVPVIYDMDDADFHLPHLAEAVTRAMPRVTAVIAGSRYIADWAVGAGAPAAHVVWTGTRPTARRRPVQAVRPPVIAWAQTRPMDYVAEAAIVRDVMARLAHRHPGLTLRLYDRHPGNDSRFPATFAAPGLAVEWRETCRYEEYLASFDDVALGFAPLAPEMPFSRGKSFGKVLAYLDARVPVLASDAGEHGCFFTSDTGVVTNDNDRMVAAADRLLADPAARQRMADSAYGRFVSHLSLAEAARRTDRILRNSLELT